MGDAVDREEALEGSWARWLSRGVTLGFHVLLTFAFLCFFFFFSIVLIMTWHGFMECGIKSKLVIAFNTLGD